MSDKTLGYCVLTILVLFFLIPALYLVIKPEHATQTRTIEFENVQSMDFLNVQDPVRINGVNVGIVKKIDIKNNKTFVQITINHSLTLFKDYKVTSTMKGLLGERFLDIYPGNPQLQPFAQDDTLKGFFVSGLSDYIPNMRKLDSTINFIIEKTNELKYGSSQNPSLVDLFNKITLKIDLLTNDINTFSNALTLKVGTSLDSLNVFFNEVTTQADAVSLSLPSLIDNCNKIVSKADLLITQLDTLVTKTTSAMISIDNADTTSMKKYFDTIQTKIEDLKKSLEILNSSELKLPVHL